MKNDADVFTPSFFEQPGGPAVFRATVAVLDVLVGLAALHLIASIIVDLPNTAFIAIAGWSLVFFLIMLGVAMAKGVAMFDILRAEWQIGAEMQRLRNPKSTRTRS